MTRDRAPHGDKAAAEQPPLKNKEYLRQLKKLHVELDTCIPEEY